ncbi:MAG: RNase H family protein [Alphaproteobacteria bacterium]
MSKKNDFHVYVDGSAMTDTNRYGIGWVKTNHKDKQPSEKSKRLPFAKACSTAAEVYAAADALEHIRKNSKVTIHSDSAAVCEAIATNKFYDKIKKSRKNKPLRKSWEKLERATQKHEEVTAFYTHEDDHPHMKTAHQLAQDGAMKPFNKESKDDKKAVRHSKGEIERDITNLDNLDNTPDYPDMDYVA